MTSLIVNEWEDNTEEIAAEREAEATDPSVYWSGICLDCEAEWNGMEGQNICPCCHSTHCDLMEEETEGDGVIS